jgi:GTP-binding protein EngB required for normal cell division
VLNKADKANQKELDETKKKIESEFQSTPYILYSCSTNKYREEALDSIFAGI